MSHPSPKPITIKKIAQKTGFSVRQIQRLAAKRGDDAMPSVKLKNDGYHNAYELTPELEKWMKAQRKRSKGRQKQVIEENDEGYDAFGIWINRIVVFNGKLERAGRYEEMSIEQLYELSEDLSAAVEVWAKVVKRFKGKLPDDLEGDFSKMLERVKI